MTTRTYTDAYAGPLTAAQVRRFAECGHTHYAELCIITDEREFGKEAMTEARAEFDRICTEENARA